MKSDQSAEDFVAASFDGSSDWATDVRALADLSTAYQFDHFNE